MVKFLYLGNFHFQKECALIAEQSVQLNWWGEEGSVVAVRNMNEA